MEATSLAAAKSFDADIAIIGKFVLNTKHSIVKVNNTGAIGIKSLYDTTFQIDTETETIIFQTHGAIELIRSLELSENSMVNTMQELQ